MASDTCLVSLPSEIKLDILSQLDAKSLLALSLTNSVFRGLIQFTPDQRVRILLELELLARHGGKVRFYGQRPKLGGDRFATAQQIEEWGRYRWTCTGCLQLLPHLEFDNRFIFGRPYRKPTHSSRPCDLVWSWNSGSIGDPVGDGDKSGGNLSITSNVIGGQRQLRRCNKCLSRENSTLLRYVDELCIHSKEAPPPAPSGRIPVASCRRIRSATAVDRFFPGFLDFLSKSINDSKETPSVRAVRYLGYHARVFPAPSFKCYMLRCSACGRWKELRSFPVPCSISFWSRQEDLAKETLFISCSRILQFDKDHPINLGCMACLAEQQYRHDSLAEVVIALFRSEIDDTIRAAEEGLEAGWSALTEFINSELPKPVVEELQTVRRILNKYNREVQNLNVPELGKIKKKLRDFMDDLRNDPSLSPDCCTQTCPRSTVAAFVRHYDVAEEQWRWLREAKTAVESTPELLINWAMDPRNIDRFPWDQPDYSL